MSTEQQRTELLDDLQARGLVQDSTDLVALRERMAVGPLVLYHGIDPSAASLHIGNFVGILVLRRFQDAGHKPIVLIGGATGMIGDPGGRSEERNLLDEELLQTNMAGIRTQIEQLVDFDGTESGVAAELVSNYDWTKDVGVLDFLRDVGKHVTVNQMVARDSVKNRMQSERGISYTEFSYMLLQAFDFWWLHENKECDLQIGGSDQWGNLAQGVDLIRRRTGDTAHALTWPLITRSDGQKFGKSVSGAVWLDPELTSPYEFHQYWMSVDDSDVERYLMQLTLVPLDDIEAVMADHAPEPHLRMAQTRLADELTTLVHGATAAHNARRAAAVLFGGEVPGPDDLLALRGIAPETEVSTAELGEEVLVDLLTATGLASSRRDARQAVADGAVRWNGGKVAHGDVPSCESGTIGLLQKGKKNRHLVVFA